MYTSFINPLDLNKRELSILVTAIKKCPICNTGIPSKSDLHRYYLSQDNTFLLGYIIYLCPSCEQLFIAKYKIHEDEKAKILTGDLLSVFPNTVNAPHVEDDVIKLSQRFYEVYSQAYQAEQQGLYEICGMGYRKALEILIKDFAIMLSPENKPQIENSHLSECINKYIQYPDIQTLAKATSWIGNDETHYVKRNPEYGLDQLKKLLEATISYVNMILKVHTASDVTGDHI